MVGESPLQRLQQLSDRKSLEKPLLTLRSNQHCSAFPASFGQLRFWSFDQQSDGTGCLVPDVLHLKGPLQVNALLWALDELLLRHEPLRSHYQWDGKDLIQRISPPGSLDIPVEALGRSDGPAEVLARLQKELDIPMDTSRSPLMRGLLLQRSSEDNILLLIFHYSAFDGWSRRVLYQDLAPLYTASLEGAPNPIPPLPIRYGDYAQWQRHHLSDRRRGDLLAYWSQKLKGLPPQRLPTVQTPPHRPTYQGQPFYSQLDGDLVRGLKRLCTRHSASLHMGLVALIAALLHQKNGQNDLSIGIPISGRNHLCLEPLIGCFINLLTLRIHLESHSSFGELIDTVARSSLEAYDHSDLPYTLLKGSLWPEQPPHAHVPVVVQLLNLPWTPSLKGLQTTRAKSPSRRARHPLEFRFRQADDRALQTKITFSTDHFDHSST